MKSTLCLIITLSSLLLLNSESLYAQTVKGTWLIEANLGDLNFSNDKVDSKSGSSTSSYEFRNSNFSLYPRVGYFLNENWVLGASFNFTFTRNTYQMFWDNGKTAYDSQSKSSQLGLLPFVRYYFTKNSKNRFYAQAGGGISVSLLGSSESNNYDYDGTLNGMISSSSDVQTLSAELLIGFNHFFTENVAFNSAIGYTYFSETYKNKSTSTSTTPGSSPYTWEYENNSLGGAFIWSFGFSVFLSGKK